MSENDKDEIKVTDKRRFDSEGKPRNAEDAEEHEKVDSEQMQSEQKTAEAASAKETDEQETQIDFKTFLVSLGTQAYAALGLVPNPVTGKKETSKDGARQLIDILAMLREKTRGNLDAAEITILDNLLYELRMQYVNLVKNKD